MLSPTLWLVLLWPALIIGSLGEQQPFGEDSNLQESWTVTLSEHWDVLGPFPIHAREQHFLSPSFPLNLSVPIDLDASWPSSYADKGSVSWSTTRSNAKGELEVSFPNVRWESLRATEGWAALQHHAVLRGTITLHPPNLISSAAQAPRLLVDLVQGSFFTILPVEIDKGDPITPKWYAGNIYAMERALPQAVDLPVLPSYTSPCRYHIYISGDYEIRLFGDPRTQGGEVPIQSIQLAVKVEVPHLIAEHVPSHDVVPDFLEGLPFGDAFGIGIRSVNGWWSVTSIRLELPVEGLRVILKENHRIAPSQTRIIPFTVKQDTLIGVETIVLRVGLTSSHGSITTVLASLSIKHHRLWTSSTYAPIKGTYFYGRTMPTAFYSIPPKVPHEGRFHPPLLALHGAGVDIFSTSFWQDSLPRQERSWIVLPSGRTSWGLDWHGPSADDAWASLDALSLLTNTRSDLVDWSIVPNTKTIVIGHSNGGQGTWHISSRYTNRVIAIVPAAGYIKSQAYIPLTQSRSSHYIDPALRAILETALTPDDNDLFMSNLAHIPVLAIHGGNDENVPVWHTREIVSILRQWNPAANVTFLEDKGEGHWYASVLNNDAVQDFLDMALTEPGEHEVDEFTLTVAVPSQSRSHHGIKIISLITSGRLARLHVQRVNGIIRLQSSNVNEVCVDGVFASNTVELNGIVFAPRDNDQTGSRMFSASGKKELKKFDCNTSKLQPSLLQSVLSTPGPLNIIISDDPSGSVMSAALRLAHDLDLYHKLDSQILRDYEVIRQKNSITMLPEGNSMVIGALTDDFPRWMLDQHKTPISSNESALIVNGNHYWRKELGIIFLHPGMQYTDSSTAALLYQDSSPEILERLLRLFPIRTGVAIPDWLVVTPVIDRVGAAGVVGAGIWNEEWTWNEVMSYIL